MLSLLQEDTGKFNLISLIWCILSIQYRSQSSELVDYGTSPDMRVQSFEDYYWEQDRMIKYRMNDKGGIKPKGYDS